MVTNMLVPKVGLKIIFLIYENARKENVVDVHLVCFDIRVMHFHVHKQRKRKSSGREVTELHDRNRHLVSRHTNPANNLHIRNELVSPNR